MYELQPLAKRAHPGQWRVAEELADGATQGDAQRRGRRRARLPVVPPVLYRRCHVMIEQRSTEQFRCGGPATRNGGSKR